MKIADTSSRESREVLASTIISTTNVLYVGLWGTLIVMTPLLPGDEAAYTPAHARPSVLVRVLSSVGMSRKSAPAARSPHTRDAESADSGIRRSTPLIGPRFTTKTGYFVAHTDDEKLTED